MLIVRVLLGFAVTLRAAFLYGEAGTLMSTPVVPTAPRLPRRGRRAHGAVPLSPG
jgi:hypothetical protein